MVERHLATGDDVTTLVAEAETNIPPICLLWEGEEPGTGDDVTALMTEAGCYYGSRN